MIEVRQAVIDDAEAIATAHIDGWRVGYRGIFPNDFLDAEEFASRRREHWSAWTWQSAPDSQLFVVSVDRRVVGFGLAGPERLDPGTQVPGAVPRGEVYAFYLHPTAWGSGGAAPLMRRCEQHLRDGGFVTAVLWVLRDNPRARAFYEKAGWSTTGEETSFSPGDSAAVVTEVQYATSL